MGTENLYKMKLSDAHTLLVFVQHYVADIRDKCKQHITMLKDDVINTIKDVRQMEEETLNLVKEEKIDSDTLKNAIHKGPDLFTQQQESVNSLLDQSVFGAFGKPGSVSSDRLCTDQVLEETSHVQQVHQNEHVVHMAMDLKIRSDL